MRRRDAHRRATPVRPGRPARTGTRRRMFSIREATASGGWRHAGSHVAASTTSGLPGLRDGCVSARGAGVGRKAREAGALDVSRTRPSHQCTPGTTSARTVLGSTVFTADLSEIYISAWACLPRDEIRPHQCSCRTPHRTTGKTSGYRSRRGCSLRPHARTSAAAAPAIGIRSHDERAPERGDITWWSVRATDNRFLRRLGRCAFPSESSSAEWRYPVDIGACDTSTSACPCLLYL
jgi:hypothetical protein